MVARQLLCALDDDWLEPLQAEIVFIAVHSDNSHARAIVMQKPMKAEQAMQKISSLVFISNLPFFSINEPSVRRWMPSQLRILSKR